MLDKIKELVEKEVNPMLAMHGGSCEIVDLNDNTVSIKLTGGCRGCPGKQMTFVNGIKPFLLENIQGLKDVKLAL